MKILYGVQATGNGHIARARAMCAAFKQRQMDVDYLFSGRCQDKYFSMDDFGNYQTRRGLTFSTHQGQVDFKQTLRNNNLWQFAKEVRALDLSDYDLVINDFEPVSAWAAKKQGKTCISISHQNAFRYAVPLHGASWLDKSIVKYFAPADVHIGLHWYHFEQPILPPIVHTLQHETDLQPFVLVYLPFESMEDITDLLIRFNRHKFVCFHPDAMETRELENLEFRPLSHSEFQECLHSCSGVIANGGFELPSEALSLGKKLLLKPLAGQFEQLSNVATLEFLGLAYSMEQLDTGAVRHWLNEQQAEKVEYPDVASTLADWVSEGNWHNQEVMHSNLWDKVSFPSYASVS